MKLSTRLFGATYSFTSVKDVLAKAGELRSGDVLAGIAAESAPQRAAARHVLSELTLGDLAENPAVPYEEDSVSRLVMDDLNRAVYDSVRNITVGDFREWLLDDIRTSEDIQRIRKGLTPEMASAVSKLMGNLDLISCARNMPVTAKANTTAGLPDRFGSRLQPNDTRDNWNSIAAQIYEGLSYGAGDILIGINPCMDSPENMRRLMEGVQDIIDRHEIPTQNCVLGHITNQMAAVKAGAPCGLLFQSIAGSEKGLAEFGISKTLLDEAYEVGRAYSRVAGPNFMYFETGQGAELSAEAHNGADQTTMEARCYGLARHYNPFMVNTVVGFIGPEYLYNDRQIIRAGLEDHFMAKLMGIPMGADCCYTNHADADQNTIENLIVLLGTAGCNFVIGMAMGDDIMLNYQTTSFHDIAAVRRLLDRRPAPEFEAWLESRGLMVDGRLTASAGDPTFFFKETSV